MPDPGSCRCAGLEASRPRVGGRPSHSDDSRVRAGFLAHAQLAAGILARAADPTRIDAAFPQSSMMQSNDPSANVRALVLMGGGARTAYQVGVLLAISDMLQVHQSGLTRFPFQVLVGTSAGALNTAFLAAAATEGLAALRSLARFWRQLRSSDVYELNVPGLVRGSRILTGMSLLLQARRRAAILDTMRLVDTLHRNVPLDGIEASLEVGAIDALAVTASSYCTGVHWTFVQAAEDPSLDTWNRSERRASLQPLYIEHLMASSAIPFLFPSTALWVDDGHEYFGDGSMRQAAPLAPAIHLGADRVLVIGVGSPRRGTMGSDGAPRGRKPTFANIAGHALASVFHDTLRADVEHTQRLNRTLQRLPPSIARTMPYRHVDILALQPSTSIDEIARSSLHEMPSSVQGALGGAGALHAGGAIPSYLLFEPRFVGALIELGQRDARARKEELSQFFSAAPRPGIERGLA